MTLLKSKEEIFNIISKILKNYDVKFAYIFGSVLNENFRDESDIDIAVSYDLPPKVTLDLYIDLEDLGRKIDLIDLEKVDTSFAFEIISSGQCIYSINEDLKSEYEMKILSNYLTLQEDRKVVIDAIYERGSVYGKSAIK
jgi:predicted nucleotidyltransferase